MKIAILSDIHDNLSMLRKALRCCQETEVLICCGDLCSPFVIKELGRGFAGAIHVVFGNNEGDLFHIASQAVKFPHIQLHGEYAELDLDGRSFSVNHFDTIGRAIAKGERYDVVCFGHNHRFEITQLGRTLVINPGEIFGGLSGHSTFAIYDTIAGEAERIECSWNQADDRPQMLTSIRDMEWMPVALFSSRAAAEPIRSRLAHAGFDARLAESPSWLQRLWFVRKGEAGVRLEVPGNQFERAETLLIQWDAAEGLLRNAVRCPECKSLRVQYPQFARHSVLPNVFLGLAAAFGLIEKEYYCEDCHFTWPREGTRAP